MGKRKPTNKELTQGLMNVNRKVDIMCSTTQKVVSDFIEFLGKEEKFKKYLEKKYESKNKDPQQSKNTKKSK